MNSININGSDDRRSHACRQVCCAPPADVPVNAEQKTLTIGGIVDWRTHSLKKRQGAHDQQPGLRKEVFLVSGMDCGDCAAKLERRLAAVPGVRSVTVSFALGKLIIEHSLADAEIVRLVQQAGFGAVREENRRRAAVEASWWKNYRTLATMASGVLLVVATGMDWTATAARYTDYLFGLAALIGGFHAARSGFYGLRSLTFDMNFLMTVAIIGAAAIGEWNEGAAVAFLFSLGNTLQSYTLDRTRQSIRSLMELAPPEATVKRGTSEMRLPVEEIAVGEVIIVKPGERIAMDGIIRSGASAINEATITGESIPVEKSEGDMVYAGTLLAHGALEITVTRSAGESTIARITHLVEEAQAAKAPAQQFVDVFASYYTPLVLIAAAGVMLLPWLLFEEPFSPWFYNGLVLLVISCPCALVISTPVSIVAAIGNASRHGVLIKGGAYLEQMGAIRAIAFDKTGTLTQGRPLVTDIIPGIGCTENELLRTAAAVEKWSEHPLAKAIVERTGGMEGLPVSTGFKALVGRGAQAGIKGRTVRIGNLRLFEERGIELAEFRQRLIELEQEGKTVMLLGEGDRILGMIAVADAIREDSRQAVQDLHKAGVQHVTMLTGDNSRIAAAIAGKIELDAFDSDLLPEDKVAAVKKIAQKFDKVVMVGDGVNDAPAMATASIGVAMGVAGSDVALETADIALMTDDLSKLSYLVRLSRKTIAIIRQNIGFSILVKIIFLLSLVLGMANLWLAVFADVGASLLVTLNGMRLMRRI
ncbi:heavy metal translocating P-type ATPase [Desulfofustis limnaeus]|uniref:P-type Zn(2+) transporter n=1 Tax=Desulfofustis limnaeus TaxID=2740163 RepID=A0ABN6LYF8_9BACT|nr:heavy metal translocating P-type ATPase [Desulfofustis limnaeus]BDD85668.1 cadmium transporter [Desulfofustis limnaeus]